MIYTQEIAVFLQKTLYVGWSSNACWHWSAYNKPDNRMFGLLVVWLKDEIYVWCLLKFPWPMRMRFFHMQTTKPPVHLGACPPCHFSKAQFFEALVAKIWDDFLPALDKLASKYVPMTGQWLANGFWWLACKMRNKSAQTAWPFPSWLMTCSIIRTMQLPKPFMGAWVTQNCEGISRWRFHYTPRSWTYHPWKMMAKEEDPFLLGVNTAYFQGRTAVKLQVRSQLLKKPPVGERLRASGSGLHHFQGLRVKKLVRGVELSPTPGGHEESRRSAQQNPWSSDRFACPAYPVYISFPTCASSLVLIPWYFATPSNDSSNYWLFLGRGQPNR